MYKLVNETVLLDATSLVSNNPVVAMLTASFAIRPVFIALVVLIDAAQVPSYILSDAVMPEMVNAFGVMLAASIGITKL